MSVSVTLSALASQLVFVRLSVSLSVVNQSISQSFNPSVGLKYATFGLVSLGGRYGTLQYIDAIQ